MTVTLSTRVDPAVRDQVDALAAALDRDRAWIVAKAVESYIAEQSDFIAAIKRGQADARNGRVTEHDDFMAELDALIESQ